MHESTRFPEGTCVLQEGQWLPLPEFLDLNGESIQTQMNRETRQEVERWAKDEAQTKKAALKQIAIRIPALLGGLAITILSTFQAPQVGGAFVITYGLIRLDSLNSASFSTSNPRVDIPRV